MLFDLGDIVVLHAFAAAITALEAVQNMFPHHNCWRKVLLPGAAPGKLPGKTPLAGKAIGPEEAALARFRIGIGPFDFHGLFFRVHRKSRLDFHA